MQHAVLSPTKIPGFTTSSIATAFIAKHIFLFLTRSTYDNVTGLLCLLWHTKEYLVPHHDIQISILAFLKVLYTIKQLHT